MIKHTNPATGETMNIEETPIGTIKPIVSLAGNAQRSWSQKKLSERIMILKKLIPIIQEKRQDIAITITKDIGKPLKQSFWEVDNVINLINFSVRNSPRFLKAKKSFMGHYEIIYEPRGTVGIISPWNYPFSTPFLSIIPALICGNSVVFKPSENSPYTGIIIDDIFSRLKQFPKNTFTLIIGGAMHGKELVRQQIDMVSFTGDICTGKDIMKNSAEKLHKLLLELGGLDAAIVLKDVNITQAAKKIIRFNTINSGQACDAIKRIYVEKEVYDSFVRSAVEEAEKITIGDPFKSVDMGPIVSKAQIDKLDNMVKDAVRKGAKVLVGGKRLGRNGYFFSPTVIVNVSNDMLVMKKEPFGPILPIIPVSGWKEAVREVNNTNYGLTGSVWTKNLKLGRTITRKLEVGVAGINYHGGGPYGMPWEASRKAVSAG